MSTTPDMRGIAVRGSITAEFAPILTPEALSFVAGLTRRHGDTVRELLARRKAVQARFDAGELPHFLPETRHVRIRSHTLLECQCTSQIERIKPWSNAFIHTCHQQHSAIISATITFNIVYLEACDRSVVLCLLYRDHDMPATDLSLWPNSSTCYQEEICM